MERGVRSEGELGDMIDVENGGPNLLLVVI